MATIMCLPDEVIDIILGNNDITIEDIINFRCVCKKFRWAAKYDKHLEKKFSQRWPSAKRLYDKQSKENEQKKSEENKQMDKRSSNFIETGINCVRQLRNLVSYVIRKHYYDNELIDNYDHKPIDNLIKFENVFHLNTHVYFRNNFDEIIYKPEVIYEREDFVKYFFIDEINNLLTQSPRRNGCDLTERYCNIKMFHYMRQCLITQKWDKLLKQPCIEQLLERTATIVAQAIQPQKDVFYSYVKASLDSIALEILNCLREKHPDHSIFSTSAETFTYWKNNNIDDNHWNEVEGAQIINTLEEYIFDKLSFRRCKLDDTNLEYMCIDYVLKNKYGQQIILLIIYHSVARRLGLRCDVIKLLYRCRFCIFWKPKYATNSLENVRCFKISFKEFPDCFVDQWLPFRILYSRRDFRDKVPTITAQKMWYEMKDLFEYLTNLYNKPFGIHPREYGEGIITCEVMLRFEKPEQLNTRPEDVKFAVGMIVTHRDQPAELPTCAGVIIGWHRHVDTYVKFSVSEHCALAGCRNPYIRYKLPLNHCRNLNFTNQQTNYIILTENNNICYVGEDAITLTTPKWIENSEIGRYFCKFEDTHYVPNKMLARFYPQDAAIVAQTTISEN